MDFIKFLMGFFTEDNGNSSNTRLRVTINNVAGVAILVGAAFGIGGSKLDANIITAATLLLGAAFGEKQIAKSQEQKVPLDSNKPEIKP